MCWFLWSWLYKLWPSETSRAVCVLIDVVGNVNFNAHSFSFSYSHSLSLWPRVMCGFANAPTGNRQCINTQVKHKATPKGFVTSRICAKITGSLQWPFHSTVGLRRLSTRLYTRSLYVYHITPSTSIALHCNFDVYVKVLLRYVCVCVCTWFPWMYAVNICTRLNHNFYVYQKTLNNFCRICGIVKIDQFSGKIFKLGELIVLFSFSQIQ